MDVCSVIKASREIQDKVVSFKSSVDVSAIFPVVHRTNRFWNES